MSGIWLVFPFIGPIRFSTVLAFVATLAVVGWFRRSPVVALVAGMGWVSGFEIAYQAVGHAVRPARCPPPLLSDLQHVGLGGGRLLWRTSGCIQALLVAWGLVFVGWMAFGFQPNEYDQPG